MAPGEEESTGILMNCTCLSITHLFVTVCMDRKAVHSHHKETSCTGKSSSVATTIIHFFLNHFLAVLQVLRNHLSNYHHYLGLGFTLAACKHNFYLS